MRTDRKHVLVIEDDVDLRFLLQSSLESDGFEVSVAANGHDGLEALRRRRADVVVTDIYMPEKEGIETVVELRQQFPQTKIIVMSGGGSAPMSNPEDYLRVARDLGAAKTIRKPFEPHELIDAVRALA
jgi:DNA-binding response OmpR family regulator